MNLEDQTIKLTSSQLTMKSPSQSNASQAKNLAGLMTSRNIWQNTSGYVTALPARSAISFRHQTSDLRFSLFGAQILRQQAMMRSALNRRRRRSWMTRTSNITNSL